MRAIYFLQLHLSEMIYDVVEFSSGYGILSIRAAKIIGKQNCIYLSYTLRNSWNKNIK